MYLLTDAWVGRGYVERWNKYIYLINEIILLLIKCIEFNFTSRKIVKIKLMFFLYKRYYFLKYFSKDKQKH